MQESCTCLHFWHNTNSPFAPVGFNPPVDKSRETKGLAPGKVLTLLGREVPNLPAEVMFSDLEIKVLSAYVKKESNPITSPGEAVKIVAKLGGYLGRANDPPPGHQLMCDGFVLSADYDDRKR